MVLELSHRLITASLDDSAQKAIEIGRNQIAVDQMQLV